MATKTITAKKPRSVSSITLTFQPCAPPSRAQEKPTPPPASKIDELEPQAPGEDVEELVAEPVKPTATVLGKPEKPLKATVPGKATTKAPGKRSSFMKPRGRRGM